MKPRVAAFVVALCLVALMISPLLATSESPLDTIYREKADDLRVSLRLSEEQSQRLEQLFTERKDNERHLRRQMRTTYTPEQQARVHKLWRERSSPGMLNAEERQQMRESLGVSQAQQRQFEAYQAKLEAHREQTLLLSSQLLDPPQRQRMREVSFAL